MSARSYVMTVDTDGAMECLWTDDLPLAEFGDLTVKRASTIEFDDMTQLWVVWIDGEDVYESPSRARCLEWEHEYINRQLMKGTR